MSGAAGAGSGARVEGHVREALERCWRLLDETIDKKQTILKTNQKNDALEAKLAAELKLNAELKERLEQKSKSGNDLEKFCTKFEKKLNITDSDQLRLNNAQEMLKIGKEYTGIRWDYSAPPNIAKGYVKNSSKMILECFNYNLEETGVPPVAADLWKYVASAATHTWDDLITNKVIDKENVNQN